VSNGDALSTGDVLAEGVVSDGIVGGAVALAGGTVGSGSDPAGGSASSLSGS
jgi:hypothetical protein